MDYITLMLFLTTSSGAYAPRFDKPNLLNCYFNQDTLGKETANVLYLIFSVMMGFCYWSYLQ